MGETNPDEGRLGLDPMTPRKAWKLCWSWRPKVWLRQDSGSDCAPHAGRPQSQDGGVGFPLVQRKGVRGRVSIAQRLRGSNRGDLLFLVSTFVSP